MKEKKKTIIAIVAAVFVVAIIASYFVMKYQTYNHIEIVETYENKNKANANYVSCMGGVLRYSRDGVALLGKTGKQKWNQPCQMGNPIVEMSEESVIVADKGGTTILVFQEKGLKGEIKTTRTIEKASVSEKGIVSAILKDDETPQVMCYDAEGEILVEHKVSVNKMGYPMDVALSGDGKTLIVSYLKTDGKKMISKVVYYYFGENSNAEKNHIVYQQDFENAIVPVAAFLDSETSLLVADNALLFMNGLKKPEKVARVELSQEVQSVAYDDKMVAVVMRSEGETAYKLHIYNKKGKELAAVDVDKEYTRMKVEKNQVLLFDGQMCSIFLVNGVHKFEGKVEENILDIFPLGGINQYMLITANGFRETRLSK